MADAWNLDVERRVIILAPTGSDAANAEKVLRANTLLTHCSVDIHDVVISMRSGCGALLVAEEALTRDGTPLLIEQLAKQEEWSDIPVVVISGRGRRASHSAYDLLGGRANVTVVERPLSPLTLLTTLRAALRARSRQYEVRELLVERRSLLDAERAARSGIEAANHLKDEFLATVSHELRTPLNSILGWAQLLLRRAPSEEFAKGLELIKKGATDQAKLIQDLLEVSRLTSGKLVLDSQPTDFRMLVEHAIDSIEPSAAVKGVSVIRKLRTDLPLISADQSRLEQVLWNLISNALKFTPRGGKVTISAIRVGASLCLEVRDTGQGISRDLLPFVFDRFRQADSSAARLHGGMGLGLSLVRSIVELHGGSVTASSAGENRGACFSIFLPILDLEIGSVRTQSTGTGEATLDGVSVLLLDDDQASRDVISRFLQEGGAVVTAVGSAFEAFSALESSAPDIIVSDIGMPQKDGYQFIREVRASGDAVSGLPAVAVTAFGRPEDRERAIAAGFQDHLVKPLEPQRLLEALARLVRPPMNASTKRGAGGAPYS